MLIDSEKGMQNLIPKLGNQILGPLLKNALIITKISDGFLKLMAPLGLNQAKASMMDF